MSRYWLFPLLFLAFMLEGTVFQWIIPPSWKAQTGISPHIVLILIIYITLYLKWQWATVLALLFGFLHDLMYYGFMIGPYTFAMGLMTYLNSLAFRRTKWTLFSTMVVLGVTVISFEYLLYGIYVLFQVIDVSNEWIFMHYILPNFVFHMLFALIIYVPFRYLLEKMKAKPKKEDI